MKHVSFSVGDGDIAIIQGPNGIGKSTFLKIISGNHRPTEGQVQCQIKKENMVFFPQISGGEFHVDVTIDDILRISLLNRYDRSRILRYGLLNEKQLKRSWNTASGGEKQRTLLTRVFLQSSNILILDEPMNHLDKETRQQVKSQILNYVNSTKSNGPRSVVMVTHEHFEITDLSRGKLNMINLGEFRHRRPGSKTATPIRAGS